MAGTGLLYLCNIVLNLFLLVLCSYLHKNEIVHGNLSLATIFIQHNGLIKIGSGELRAHWPVGHGVEGVMGRGLSEVGVILMLV